jgi:hypothetical protein
MHLCQKSTGSQKHHGAGTGDHRDARRMTVVDSLRGWCFHRLSFDVAIPALCLTAHTPRPRRAPLVAGLPQPRRPVWGSKSGRGADICHRLRRLAVDGVGFVAGLAKSAEDGKGRTANRASTGTLQGSSQTRQCVRAIFRSESRWVLYSGPCETRPILEMSGAGQRAEFLNWRLKMLQP